VKITVALRLAAIELPAAIEALGEAEDQRALPILLHGLKSPDCYVVNEAAFGLARLHDIRAVDALIQAAQTNIQELRLPIAKALLNFDSAEARSAAESLIDDPDRLRRWRAEVEARGRHALTKDREK
jgi:HEAT repeat protein